MTSEGEVNISSWANRVTLVIPIKQMKRICNGKAGQVMKGKRWYELRPEQIQPVYDSNGKELSKAQLRSILRKM